jgi:hypothetical protein
MRCPYHCAPDGNIKVNYYKVRDETLLHQATAEHLKGAAEFVRYAERLVAKYNADSAILDSGDKGIKIRALNFTYENTPLDWIINRWNGYLSPKEGTKAYADFYAILPFFKNPYPEVLDEMRFCAVGKDIILSVTPNKDGTICQVPDAYVLDDFTFGLLKERASEKEKERLRQLGRQEWRVAPFKETKIFTASKEAEQMNKEREYSAGSLMLGIKHSPTCRRIKRLFESPRPQ